MKREYILEQKAGEIAQVAIVESSAIGIPNGHIEPWVKDFAIGVAVDTAKWADSHPQWYDAQGDDVPEYGREVIVIGRDGKVFYGHRPDPKEVTMVDGKPYHAKTYDKNGWNWPDIALWLDVEIPHEKVDKIATEYYKEKYFKENK
jgi:hypothetical protein